MCDLTKSKTGKEPGRPVQGAEGIHVGRLLAGEDGEGGVLQD